MSHHSLPATRRLLLAVSCLALGSQFFLAACAPATGGGTTGGQSTPSVQATKPPVQTPATSASPAPAKAATPTAAAKASTSPSAASLDACSLLTRQEVEAAVGASVTDPQREGSGPSVACRFKDPKHTDFDVVNLSIIIGTDASDAKFAYDLGKKNAGDAKAVTGLGDDAYWVEFLSTLEVLKGKYDISIAVAPDAKDPLSIAQGLASKALGRLP